MAGTILLQSSTPKTQDKEVRYSHLAVDEQVCLRNGHLRNLGNIEAIF